MGKATEKSVLSNAEAVSSIPVKCDVDYLNISARRKKERSDCIPSCSTKSSEFDAFICCGKVQVVVETGEGSALIQYDHLSSFTGIIVC